jgi:drug/metabolite transporter (DMT)-like permease
VVGLGFASVGASQVAAVATLGGFIALIFGIHSFGRLGCEMAVGAQAAREKRLSNILVLGVLGLGLGVLLLADSRLSRSPLTDPSLDRLGGILLATAAAAAGAIATLWARKRLGRAERRPSEVEKSKRLRKSPRP